MYCFFRDIIVLPIMLQCLLLGIYPGESPQIQTKTTLSNNICLSEISLLFTLSTLSEMFLFPLNVYFAHSNSNIK